MELSHVKGLLPVSTPRKVVSLKLLSDLPTSKQKIFKLNIYIIYSFNDSQITNLN